MEQLLNIFIHIFVFELIMIMPITFALIIAIKLFLSK